MKRVFAWMLVLCLLLAGCGTPEPVPPAELPPDRPSAPALPDAPTVPEEPEPLPEAAARSAILDTREFLDDAGVLGRVPNTETESGLMRKVLLTDRGLVLYGSGVGENGGPAFGLTLLDTDDGRVLAEASIPGLELPSLQQTRAGIVVTDWADGRMFLLDDGLNTVKEFRAQAANCGVYADPDFTRAFVMTKASGVEITDMATGEKTVLLPNATHLLAAGESGSFVTVTYTDRVSLLQCYAVVDLETATVSGAPFEGGFSGLNRAGEMWLARVVGSETVYWLGKTGRPNAFTPAAKNSQVELLPDGRLLSFTYGREGTDLHLYDADGQFRSACRLPAGTGLSQDPAWSEADGGYWFAIVEPTGHDILLFWDLSVPAAGQDLTLRPAYEKTPVQGSALPGELYDRAAGLEKHGVTVRIGETVQTEFVGYTVTPETDAAYVAAGLDTLEQVLSAYPAGFFPQLRYGTVREIVVHLTGTIATRETAASGFTTFVGFVETGEGVCHLTLDITAPGDLAQTAHHEIFHLMDNRMTFDAGLRADALYSEAGWNALNPPGFTYPNSYSNLGEEFFTAPVEQWFTELYSRTYPREDRATVFEYAAMGTEWIFSGAPRRLRKLEYLCRCIRDCFDTSGWPAATVWETVCLRAGGSL